MPQSHASPETLGHEGADAFAKVAHHLKILIAQLSEEGGDALSATAVALGHAAVDLVGEAQAKLDEAQAQVRREVSRHPIAATASASAAAVLVAAAVASLATYVLARRKT